MQTLKADIGGGLVGSLTAHTIGDLLSDFVQLARAALDNNSIPVAAVLSAAAFEDTIRRLAALKGLPHREKLADSLSDLEEAAVLVGPQVGIANSYLKFRNDALHAQWAAIDRPAVSSALGFIEELLLRHFA